MAAIDTWRMCGYNVKEHLEQIFSDTIKGISVYAKYDQSVTILAAR